MMESPLFRIRDLLRDGESLSAAEIAQCLDLPQDLVDAGLQHWQSRGQIAQVLALTQTPGSGCQSACAGACAGCVRPQPPTSAGTRYRWRAKAA